MPFLFLVVGVLFVVSAVRGTHAELLSLLKGDFTGKNNFIYWTLAILFIGALGYIQDLKPVSRAFLVLLVVVLFLSNGGVFQKFTQAIGVTQQAPPTIGATQTGLPITGPTTPEGFANSVNLENELGPLTSL